MRKHLILAIALLFLLPLLYSVAPGSGQRQSSPFNIVAIAQGDPPPMCPAPPCRPPSGNRSIGAIPDKGSQTDGVGLAGGIVVLFLILAWRLKG